MRVFLNFLARIVQNKILENMEGDKYEGSQNA